MTQTTYTCWLQDDGDVRADGRTVRALDAADAAAILVDCMESNDMDYPVARGEQTRLVCVIAADAPLDAEHETYQIYGEVRATYRARRQS